MNPRTYELTAKVQRFTGVLGDFEQRSNERKYGNAILGFIRADGKGCLVYERGQHFCPEIRDVELFEFVEELSRFFPTNIVNQRSFILSG